MIEIRSGQWINPRYIVRMESQYLENRWHIVLWLVNGAYPLKISYPDSKAHDAMLQQILDRMMQL